MSKNIDNALDQAFDPTPGLFSRQMTATLRNLPPRRAPLHWRRLALALSVPALAAVGIALAWQGGAHPVDRTNQSASLAASAAATSAGEGNTAGVTTQQNEDVFNILLLGVDTREAESFSSARSDTVMLLSVDTKNKTIKLTSFLRDILVDTGAGKKSRLNATMANNGPHGIQQALQDNFGVQTDKYAVVNFWTFADIIDTLGGVEVDVQPVALGEMNRCIQEMNGLAGGKKADEIAQAGMQHLDGRQTVAYLRVRHIENGDRGRVERQQAVLDQLIAKMSNLSLDQVTQIAKALPELTQSNLSPGYILDMAAKLYAVRGAQVQQMTVPVEGSYRNENVDGMAVLTVDFERNRQALQSFLSAGVATALLDTTPSPTAYETAFEQPKTTVAQAEIRLKDGSSFALLNIEEICSRLDGTVIAPGQTFSFWGSVGQEGIAALQQYQGTGIDRIPQPGVGLVSTAIYQSAACAGLTVAERHTQAPKFPGYVHMGQEANVDTTLNYDLKLTNPYAQPVVLRLSADDFVKGKVMCTLLCDAPDAPQGVTLESHITQTLNPLDTTMKKPDSAVPEGETVIVPSHKGYVVVTEKVLATTKGKLKRQPFTTDTYPAECAILYYHAADPQPTVSPDSTR